MSYDSDDLVPSEEKTPGPLKTQPSSTPSPSPPKGAHGSSPPARKADDEAFERFWTAYPRKVGKPKAKAAWLAGLRRISGPDPPSVIQAGLEAQLPGWSVREPDLIPHPTTWLNRDGWEDQPDQANLRQVNGLRSHPNDAAQRSEDRMRRIFSGAQIAAGTRRHDFGS